MDNRSLQQFSTEADPASGDRCVQHMHVFARAVEGSGDDFCDLGHFNA